MKKTFTARIKHLDSALGWRIVDVPFDVKKAFGKGGQVPVKGTVNGFAFQTSLFPRKDEPHYLMLNKAMQKGADATQIGDAIEVVIEHDTSVRRIDVPQDWADALEEVEGLREYFDAFSYSMRKWLIDYVTSAKTPETRVKRSMDMVVRLAEMRDGEIDPPPILQREFAQNPRAKIGWDAMPIKHRRSHLWGIFYYSGEESKRKRLDKAINMMMEYADKRKK